MPRQIVSLLFFLLLAMLSIPGCGQGGAATTLPATATPLVPDLARKLDKLTSITIRYQQNVLSVVSEDGIWYLDSSDRVRAAGSKLNFALSELIRAPQGQRVTLSKSDYRSLMLCTTSEATDGNGVEVTLTYEDPSDIFQMVLGTFDVEEKSDHANMFGDKAAARRYVRVLGNDKVYLTSATLNFLEAEPVLWENNQFPPIRQLEHLLVTEADGFSWKASKTSSFSPISFAPPFEATKTTPHLIKVFEIFFQEGFHEGIVPRSSDQMQSSKSPAPLYAIEAKDRFGGTYKVSVLREQQAHEARMPKRDFKPGTLMFGGNKNRPPALRVCRLDIELPDPDELEQNMLDSISGREITFFPGNFEIIEQITAGLKNHEETK